MDNQQIGALHHQQQGAIVQEMFRNMDLNGDGNITKDGFARFLAISPHAWPLSDCIPSSENDATASQTSSSFVANLNVGKEIYVDFWFEKLTLIAGERQHKAHNKGTSTAAPYSPLTAPGSATQTTRPTTFQEVDLLTFWLTMIDDHNYREEQEASLLLRMFDLSGQGGLTRTDVIALLLAVDKTKMLPAKSRVARIMGSHTRLGKEELKVRLRSVAGDLKKLGSKEASYQDESNCMMLTLVGVLSVAVAAAVFVGRHHYIQRK